MKKNHFFNMNHILHRLYDLTDVIWVIMSKKKNITPVVSKNRYNTFLKTDIIYFFYHILKFALLIRV